MSNWLKGGVKMKTNEENATVWGIHCTIDEESMFHKNSVMAIRRNDMGDLSKLESGELEVA